MNIMADTPKAYVLASSSKGNSAVIFDENDALIIDAGISARRITNALISLGCPLERVRAVLITHEHSDHIFGLEVLSKKLKVPIFAPDGSIGEIVCTCPSTFRYINPVNTAESMTFRAFTVTACPTPHDSEGSVAYRFSHTSGREIGYATDIGHITRPLVDLLQGCEYLVLESNHDIPMLENGPYPPYLKARILGPGGHLANQSITKMLPYMVKTGTRRIILAHLSQENNTPEAAYISALAAMQEYGFKEDKDFTLEVASPSEITTICN